MKKIGILGSGAVAKALGSGFIKYGYEVMLGSRDMNKLADWKASSGEQAHTGSFAEAATFGELVVLAVKGSAAADALQLAGPQNLEGKTVIDTTNPIGNEPPKDGVLHYFSSINYSLMEELQDKFSGAHFVKAFNSVGNMFMVDPVFPGGKASMFICGNNDTAKREVKDILDRFGWETWDMGKAAAARAIEPLCMLWCIPGFLQNQWTHAFKLMKA
jgi:predicted dinucleotide-binding enzyme